MRVLILALVAYIAAVVTFWRRPEAIEDASDPVPETGQHDLLTARLSDAATAFGAAAREVPDTASAFKAACTRLAGQCAELGSRAAEDDAFARRARVAVLRLLHPLYGVVRRATSLSQRESTPAGEALLTSAADLTARAGDTLQRIAERADETALRHLETDLEILEERLSGDPER